MYSSKTDRSSSSAFGGRSVATSELFDQLFEPVDAGFVGNRDGVSARHLEAVVDRGVVARRHLDATRRAEETDAEIVLRRVGDPDIDHRDTPGAQTVLEGSRHRDRVRTHIAGNHDHRATGQVLLVEEIAEVVADLEGGRFVELIGVGSPDVVRLEDPCHCHSLSFDSRFVREPTTLNQVISDQ